MAVTVKRIYRQGEGIPRDRYSMVTATTTRMITKTIGFRLIALSP
jgi:hypothetical protein